MKENSVFEQTYRDYLSRIESFGIKAVADKMGRSLDCGELAIDFMNETFTVSEKGIYDRSGCLPGFERCVVIFKYLLMFPESLPEDHEWTAYRDLKNAGPLEKYFRNEVELSITRFFSGKVDALRKAVDLLGGVPPGIQLNYDLAAKITLMPEVPVIITFNDEDEEFPAACSVLFENHAEAFLDAESLAILGNIFAEKLKTLSLK